MFVYGLGYVFYIYDSSLKLKLKAFNNFMARKLFMVMIFNILYKFQVLDTNVTNLQEKYCKICMYKLFLCKSIII